MTLVAFLDREHQQLVRHDGPDLLLALPRYLTALGDEPDLGPVVNRLETEAIAALEAFTATQTDQKGRAQQLRAELVGMAREIDDSDMEETDFTSDAHIDYMFSLARFDALMRGDIALTFPRMPAGRVEPGPVPELLNILRGRIMVAQYGERSDIPRGDNHRPDLDPLGVEILNVGEEHNHAYREFHHSSRTLPGVALARLQEVAKTLNPEPHILDPAGDWMGQALDRVLRTMFTPDVLIQRAVNGGHLDDDDRRRLDEIITQIRGQIELAHEGLVRAARVVQAEQDKRLGARAVRVLRHIYSQYVVAILGALAVAFLVAWLVER